MNKSTLVILACAAAFALPGARAADKAAPQPKAQSQTHSGTGTVKAVDAAKGKVKLDHDEIKSLEWPRMTMDFTVRDKAQLDAVKPGDRVRFELVKAGSAYAIQRLEPVKP